MAGQQEDRLVGRGAYKLLYALDEFKEGVRGETAADLGASTGGFTQALLRNGAARVYAIDTAYGQLDWKLRNDDRVKVMERTNALFAELPEAVDLAVIDTGWTPQKKILPRALKMVRPGGRVISLVKPHYEAKNYGCRFKGGRLDPDESRAVLDQVIADLRSRDMKVVGSVKSPITGGKGGNTEFFILIIN